MLVPTFWAEARVQEKTPARQVTVRRFGWSDIGQAEAEAHAAVRAREALARILAGEARIQRRDFKVPYNGGDGLPIREEIVERRGAMIVTRNSYGARCLNVPNVLFADIDLVQPRRRVDGCGMVISVVLFVFYLGRLETTPVRIALVVLAALTASWLVEKMANCSGRRQLRNAGVVLERLKKFVAQNPEWHLRLYRTPAGYRVLAMQRTFDPGEPAVAEAFKAWGVDRVYALMCSNQQCFRARLTAKPWRIGITKHMRPRPGVWPVAPERLPERTRWIANYEDLARGFAACRFEKAIGSGAVVAETEAVRGAHDAWCGADADLPLA